MKEIGAYKHDYSVESKLIPRELIYSYFTGLLSGLDEIVDEKSKLKLIGKAISKKTDFPYGSKTPEEFLPKKNGGSVRNYLAYLGSMIPFVPFIYRNKIETDTMIHEDGKKALYRIKNLRDLSDYMINHFYIMVGVIEYWIKINVGIDVICQVENIDFKKNFVEISLEFL
jgi:hypothetical protein